MKTIRYNLQYKVLEKYIKYIWILETNKLDISHTLLPVNSIDLIINFNSPITYLVNNKKMIINNKPFFLGPINKPLLIKQKDNIKIIGISFKPFGFFNLINKPIYNYKNKLIYLDDISKKLSYRLIEDLDNTNKSIKIIRKIEKNLLKLLKYQSIDDYHYKVIKMFLNNGYKNKINSFSKKVGLSSRQLLRIFKKYTGFSPKEFSKITRFQILSQELLDNNYKSLSDLAIKYGYYDQMHFIKDCKKITCQTPLKLNESKISIK